MHVVMRVVAAACLVSERMIGSPEASLPELPLNTLAVSKCGMFVLQRLRQERLTEGLVELTSDRVGGWNWRGLPFQC